MADLLNEILDILNNFGKQLTQEGYAVEFKVNMQPVEHQITLPPIRIVDDLVAQLQNAVKNSSQRDHVQIKADKKEMNRRIAAFMKHKRAEVDELNLQEFCNRPHALPAENSCARVDAVLLKRAGSKSHIKVSRVVNQWGPQTAPQLHELFPLVKREKDAEDPTATAIEERILNMESHLNLKTAQGDVFERLKKLEDRMLFLEGLSPDYFETTPKKVQRLSKPQHRGGYYKRIEETLSVEELDARIAMLKDSLKQKQRELQF